MRLQVGTAKADYDQCDQIGRNFAPLAKFQKSLAIFASLFSILNLLWLIFYAFGQISLLTMANYGIKIQPSGHTDYTTLQL